MQNYQHFFYKYLIFFKLLYNKNMNLKKLLLTSILINGLLLSSCDLSDDNNSSSISLKDGYRSLFLDESTNGVVVKGDLNHSYKVGSEVRFSIIDQDDVDEEVYLNNRKLSPYLEESINGINYIDYVFEMPDEDVVVSCVLNKHVPLNEIYPFIDDLSADSIKEVYFSDYTCGTIEQISRVEYTNNKSDFNNLIDMLKNCYVVKDNEYGGFISGGTASYLDIHLLDNNVKRILINNHYVNNVSGYKDYFIKNYYVKFDFGNTYKCFLPPTSSIDNVFYNDEKIGGIENLIINVLFVEDNFELSDKHYVVRSDFYSSDILIYDKNHFSFRDKNYKTVGDKDFSILFSKFNYI